MKLNSSPLFEAIQARAIEQPNRPCLAIQEQRPRAHRLHLRPTRTEDDGIGPGDGSSAAVSEQANRDFASAPGGRQALHFLAALAAGLTPVILTPPNRKLNKDYYLQMTRGVLDQCQFSALITDVARNRSDRRFARTVHVFNFKKPVRSETISDDKALGVSAALRPARPESNEAC